MIVRMLGATARKVLFILIYNENGGILNSVIIKARSFKSAFLYELDQSAIPINIREVGIDALNFLLLEACIK